MAQNILKAVEMSDLVLITVEMMILILNDAIKTVLKLLNLNKTYFLLILII